MKYILCYILPDSDQETEEEYESILEMQNRKDKLLLLPWLCPPPSIYASDEDGNEVYLK